MKLKTLKDIIHKETKEHHEFLDVKELKQEAIKWVKSIGNGISKYYLKEWIKEFFNITEEDLKEAGR